MNLHNLTLVLVFILSTKKELEPQEQNLEEKQDIELDNDKLKPLVKLPLWLRIILMILPAGIIVGIIMAIDLTVGFPENLFPTAVIAITGLSLFGIVVIGDMLYRNVFVYRMLQMESKKSRVYKQIIKDKKEEAEAKARHEFEQESEYEYDDEEIYEEEDEETEYKYDVEEDTLQDNYKMKSYILRGGILTILIVNAVLLLVLAAILQGTYYGGFVGSE